MEEKQLYVLAGYDAETEKLLQALPLLLASFSACQGKVTSLHLYEFFPARHICTVQLQG